MVSLRRYFQLIVNNPGPSLTTYNCKIYCFFKKQKHTKGQKMEQIENKQFL